jgi:aryl-alcohol dehydrogenase-like predicted oxidoreductase
MERRQFVRAGLLAGAVASGQGSGEWRNKQPGMAYRKLGRTGMMISEVVSGGDPVRDQNWKHINLAIEMGLNYLDMAPAYGQGECERSYAKVLAGSSAMREKVFLTTKISNLTAVRNRMYQEVYDGLPGEKKSAIDKRAAEMRAQRMVDKPGYFIEYYPGMRNQLTPTYRTIAMMADYGHRVDASAAMKDFVATSLEGSLKRVGTDYFDIVMAPHGAAAPEEVNMPEVHEIFLKLKQAGKVRFLGATTHNDPAGVLRKAVEVGYYDVIMAAYNVINGGYMDEAVRQAADKGVGFIGMKVAMSVATQHKQLQPVPQWRIDKVNRVVPGEMKAPMKAYLWALQNPNLCGVISNLWDETYVKENLSLAGKKVELQPA